MSKNYYFTRYFKFIELVAWKARIIPIFPCLVYNKFCIIKVKIFPKLNTLNTFFFIENVGLCQLMDLKIYVSI